MFLGIETKLQLGETSLEDRTTTLEIHVRCHFKLPVNAIHFIISHLFMSYSFRVSWFKHPSLPPKNPPTLWMNESLESSSSSTSGLGGPDFLGSATSSMTNSSWQQCLSEAWQMSRAFFGPKTEEWNGMGMRMRGGFRNNECHSRDFFIGFFCFQKKDKEGHVSVIISLCHEQNLHNMPLYRISIVVHTPVNQRTMGMHLFPLEHHLLELHLLSCWNFHPNAKYLESIKSTEKSSFSLFGCVSPKKLPHGKL